MYAATVVKSSIVIRKATLFNVMYACMHIRTYMCVIAYECSNGPAPCNQHVTHETTDVGIM